MNFYKKNKKEGYAVLELLFYISFFAVLSIVVINSMIIMSRAFHETTLQAEFLQNSSIMERMSREIRNSYDVDDVASTINYLKLNTKDSSGNNKIVEFKFINSNIEFSDAGVNMGNLNTLNTVVTGLVFTRINTTVGKAVKIKLSVRSGNDSSNRIVDFYDTVVLRGSY